MIGPDRRALLAGAGAASLLATAARAADSSEALGDLAMTYALPLFEMHAARTRILSLGAKVNTLVHSPTLTAASARQVTTPNVDTLYSTAWLDLSEPVTLTTPPGADRYLSVALMDMYSNDIAVLHPGEGARIVGPGSSEHSGELRPRVIASPTPSVWLLARTYASGEADLAAARALQRQIRLEAASSAPRTPSAPPEAGPRDTAAFFKVVNRLLQDEPPPARDAPVLKRIAAIGVGPGLTWSDGAAASRGAMTAYARAGAGGFSRGAPRGGWFYPKPDLGRYGTDYAFRAQVALGGLAALPIDEAIYLQGVGDGSGVYDGARAWRLRFPPGGDPPNDAFWSLTLYERTPEGRQYFFDTPTKRYALKSAAPDLVRTPTGGVEIAIQPNAPTGAPHLNWLPSPRGPCTLLLRVYRPRPALLKGAWTPPRITLA